MPEGDTVYRAARTMNEALAGAELTSSDFRVPAFATLDLAGETVHEVVSRGKHLLHRIGDVTVHSHLKMEGSWHVYSPEGRWRRPAYQARAVLRTDEHQAIGFDLGVLEIVPRDREDDVVGHLGPDLLGPDWDEAEALRRLGEKPDVPIDVALLDQRNLAGLGNVYANELCFLRGVLPTRPVGEVDLARIVALGHRTIHANRDRMERTFTGDTRRGRMRWVYGRAGQPCRRCGTRIQEIALGRTELSERRTFFCPHCQT